MLSFSILFLVLTSFSVLDSIFISSQERGIMNENGVLLLKPNEIMHVQDIRKTYDGIIYIPEENIILGSSSSLERDSEEINKIVGRWNK